MAIDEAWTVVWILAYKVNENSSGLNPNPRALSTASSTTAKTLSIFSVLILDSLFRAETNVPRPGSQVKYPSRSISEKTFETVFRFTRKNPANCRTVGS